MSQIGSNADAPKGARSLPNPRRLLLPAVLLLLFAGQCLWFIGTQSMTVDEPFHLLSGMSAWRQGEFKERDDNPPGPRLLYTAFIPSDWEIQKRHGYPVEAVKPDAQAMLWRARPVGVLFGVILGITLWCAARRFFNERAANFALALFALSPALIANFSLATHDGPATLMIFAAVWQLARWREQPTRAQTALLGLLLGLLLVSKHSAAPMFALAMACVLLLRAEGVAVNPLRWQWGKTLLVAAIAFLVVWSAYFFHVSRVTLRDGQLTATFPNYPLATEVRVPARINATLYLPAGEYLTGVMNVAQNSRRGFHTYFLGEVSTGGRRAFFPVVMGLKWPTIILVLAAAGLVLWMLRRVSFPRGLRLMLLFPAVYFLMSMMSNMNFGDRHILPIYPFLLLLAAGAWHGCERRRGLTGALLVLLALQTADTLRYAPDYLSYFNPFVESDESYKLLADSNLDWGQGLLALREYEAAHPDEQISLAYFGNVVPQTVYGLRARRLSPNERASAIVVVSASHLAGHLFEDPSAYRWVLRYPRRAILNHSLHVFEVPAGAASE